MARLIRKTAKVSGSGGGKINVRGRGWTKEDLRELKNHSREKTPAKTIAKLTKRTVGALRQKAFILGLPLGRSSREWTKEDLRELKRYARKKPPATTIAKSMKRTVAAELGAKQFGLLRELVPGAARIAVLINPANAQSAGTTVTDVEAAARTMGLQIQIFNASTGREINAALAAIARERSDALFIGGDPYFTIRRVQLANLAARHAIPASYVARDFPEAGGLMSYGTNITDAYRQVGVYAGRILKGAKSADLPVVQASKFELVINLATAMMLGLEVPPTVLARADEVIE